MALISRLLKKCVSPLKHFGTHNGLNGHLVDSADNSNRPPSTKR